MKFLGQRIQRFASVDSTNAVARRLAECGAPEGTCIVAGTQSAGRGRLGREWHSPPGGLWLSVILRPRVAPRDIGKLSLVAGVAATEAIREVVRLPAMTKWPNDVVVAGKKVCGVLVEGRWQGGIADFLVAGIGINVAIDLAALPPGVRAAAGTLLEPRDPNALAVREALLGSLLKELETFYRRFLSGDFSGILEKARLYSDTLGRQVVAAGSDARIQGTAVDIDSDAALIVRTPLGDVRVVSGDVTIRGVSGGYSG
ncbi:MAG: biotin--[acetyl-CoA-carboxylase] ligase [Bacillota bacterium]